MAPTKEVKWTFWVVIGLSISLILILPRFQWVPVRHPHWVGLQRGITCPRGHLAYFTHYSFHRGDTVEATMLLGAEGRNNPTPGDQLWCPVCHATMIWDDAYCHDP